MKDFADDGLLEKQSVTAKPYQLRRRISYRNPEPSTITSRPQAQPIRNTQKPAQQPTKPSTHHLATKMIILLSSLLVVMLLIIGLVIGHLASHHPATVSAKKEITKAASPLEMTQSVAANVKGAEPIGSAAKPAKPKVPVKPVFDFYSVLTGKKMPSAQASTAATSSTLPSQQPMSLQVISTADQEVAERVQAKLILLGLTPVLKQSNGQYRVILGPFDAMDTAKQTQQMLQSNGIESAIVSQG